MADLNLTFAITPYDRVLPLLYGEVKPSGITLDVDPATRQAVSVPRLFYEQIKFQRHDVSEMSFSSYLIERAKGWPYVALPVFHNRNFRYTNIAIRTEAGISQDHPEDLKGKRFAIPDYQMSMGLWMRGILQHEFEVRPADMEWFQLRGERYSHTGASHTQLPPGVRLNFANAEEQDLFARGEVDASLGLNVTGRGISTLFSDPKAEAVRFYRKHGVFPPHHITVVRESVLEAHPWVALSLMDAFEQAKKTAAARLRNQTLFVFGQQYLRDEHDVFGGDPFVYGVKANRTAIEMVQTFSVEQVLTHEKAPLERLFPEEVLIAEEATIRL